jgi:hypothetical protein
MRESSAIQKGAAAEGFGNPDKHVHDDGSAPK